MSDIEAKKEKNKIYVKIKYDSLRNSLASMNERSNFPSKKKDVNIIYGDKNDDGKSYVSSLKKISEGLGIVFHEFDQDSFNGDKTFPYLILGLDELRQKALSLNLDLGEYSLYCMDSHPQTCVAESATQYVRIIENSFAITKNNGIHRAESIVVIGRSDNACETAKMLLQGSNKTVTVVHTGTTDIYSYTKNADCIISFAGCPDLITADAVMDNAIIVPVGMKKVDGKWKNDIDEESFEKSPKKIYIADGVGQLTSFFTVKNIIEFYNFETT